MNGTGKIKKVSLDSNIFIYNLENNPQFVLYTDKIFKKLIENKLKASTSIISLIELLSFPNTENLANKIAEDFYETPNLSVVDITAEVAKKAAQIRRDYKYKLPDSIQLATALLSKSQVFITNDQKLKSFKGLKVILLSEI